LLFGSLFEGLEYVLLKGDKKMNKKEVKNQADVVVGDFLLGFEELGVVKNPLFGLLTKDDFLEAVDAAFHEIMDDDSVVEHYKEIAALQHDLLVREVEEMDFK